MRRLIPHLLIPSSYLIFSYRQGFVSFENQRTLTATAEACSRWGSAGLCSLTLTEFSLFFLNSSLRGAGALGGSVHPLNIFSSRATKEARDSMVDPRTSTLLSTRNSCTCAVWICFVVSIKGASTDKYKTAVDVAFPRAYSRRLGLKNKVRREYH